MPSIIQEKLDQAAAILDEHNDDVWLTFVRETVLTPDPALDLIAGMEMVWQSAFIVTREGSHYAIVGKHDRENIERLGAYREVTGYVEGIRNELVRVLMALNPQTIALNYSENDVAADGLSHGLMKLLSRYLQDTGLDERFVSAEAIISALRGRKSPQELDRIRQAVKTTEGIFEQVGAQIKPGQTEAAIGAFVHDLINEKRLGTAWDYDYCPTVSCGPDSPVGHAGPSPDYAVTPGTLVHMDFGVKENGFCADLQRVWYIRREGEDDAPEEVRAAFNAARLALTTGFDALKPGVHGWQIDEAARQTLIDTGYPAYEFAFGHHVGRMAHDGATVLGPRWERYGQTPYGVIEAGNVFAIELGVFVENYGYIGLEENVLVTEKGAEWLSTPQESLWLV
ncbi:MAG: M24 family metallopeptidase [Anaerolineae bacterium]